MATTAKIENVWEEHLFPDNCRLERCRNLDYFRVVIPFRLRHHNCIGWCEQNFGPRPGPKKPDGPGERWYPGIDSFYFREEQDAVLFVLRWSGQ